MANNKIITALALVMALFVTSKSVIALSSKSQNLEYLLKFATWHTVQHRLNPMYGYNFSAFENECPQDLFFYPHILPSKEEVQHELEIMNDSQFAKFFFNTFLPLVLGKSIELLQHDLCLARFGDELTQDALIPFCQDPQNLFFSRAQAKSLGKMAKTLQGKKGLMALMSAYFSTYASVKLSERLLDVHLATSQVFFLSTSMALIEPFLRPQFVKEVLGEKYHESYEAFDHWLSRPFILRTANLAFRYTLEKQMRTDFIDQAVIDRVRNSVFTNTFYTQHQSEIIARGISIGASKVITGAVAATCISLAELTYDAWQDEPFYNTTKSQLNKLLSDAAIAISTNIAVGLLLPTTVTTLSPRGVLSILLLGHALNAMGEFE